MGSVPIPECAPTLTLKEPYEEIFSESTVEEMRSSPEPPYSSGTPPPRSPISPAFLRSWAIRPSLCCSSSGMSGVTSLVTNSSADWPISRWSSVSSAGLKTSSARGESRRKLPPGARVRGVAVVAICPPKIYEGKKLREALENARGTHAASDAHGYHAITRLAALEFADNCGGKLRSRAAERMAESDGAAIDVNSRGIQGRKANHGKRLRGEGLVQFDYVDLLEFQAGQAQRLGNGKHGANAHLFRRAAGSRKGDESRQRLHAEGAGAVGAHHHRDCGSIAHLGAITSRNRAVSVKRGFQPREGVDRRIGASAFVGVEDFGGRFGTAATAVSVGDVCAPHFDRDNLILEFSRGDGGQS